MKNQTLNSERVSVASTGLVRHWRVTTARDEPSHDIRNAFLIQDVFQISGRTRFRTYEFDAVDEDDCRRYFDAAQKEGMDEVRGFSITKIEEIPLPNSKLSQPEAE